VRGTREASATRKSTLALAGQQGRGDPDLQGDLPAARLRPADQLNQLVLAFRDVALALGDFYDPVWILVKVSAESG
jgi:hypothetical protein